MNRRERRNAQFGRRDEHMIRAERIVRLNAQAQAAQQRRNKERA